MIRSLFWFVASLLLSATLAAGEAGCSGRALEINTSRKGSLFSPMYGRSQEYPPNLICHYYLTAPFFHKIKLTFKDFDVVPSTQCASDHLLIFGTNSSTHFCGNQLPRPMVSKHETIMITFRSDFIQGGRGFHIEYESSRDMQLCDEGQIECQNRNCYDPKQQCDGVDDCGDGTDEENCSHTVVVNPKECGTTEIPPRISEGADRVVGGEEVVPNSWPWQVSLQLPRVEPNGHYCGGTLINALWVLTAKHCVDKREDPGAIKVVVGSHGKFTTTQYQQVRYSDKVASYPGFPNADIHDMSLIRLNAAVTMNPGVQPACLPDFGYNPKPGWQCYATGWGETRGSGFSHSLKQTLQTVQTQQECSVMSDITQVCVGNTAQSACHGDSGGPLNCKVENKWYVMGAASYVTTGDEYSRGLCAGPGAYSVYATTAFKYDWIKDVITKDLQL